MRYDAKKSTVRFVIVMMFRGTGTRAWENSGIGAFHAIKPIFGKWLGLSDIERLSGFETGSLKAIPSESSPISPATALGLCGGSSPIGWIRSRLKKLISLIPSISSMMGPIFIKRDASSASWRLEVRRLSLISTNEKKDIKRPWDGFGSCAIAAWNPFISLWMGSYR